MAKDKRNGQGRPEAVLMLMDMDWKQFKKNNKGVYGSKKELKQAYLENELTYLPETIDWVVRFGYRESEADVKEKLYSVMFQEDVIKMLLKYSENSEFRKDFWLAPIVIRDMIAGLADYLNEEKDEERLNAMNKNITDITKVSENILKKRIKKLEKKGITRDIAFELLSIVPKPDAMKYSTFFRVSKFIDVLYAIAKNPEVQLPVDVIFEEVIGEVWYTNVVDRALLERNDKYAAMTESQQKVFNDITNWIFQLLEDSDADIIRAVLMKYFQKRKKDMEEGRDSARRYFLSALPETQFPRITKVVAKMTTEEPLYAKFI